MRKTFIVILMFFVLSVSMAHAGVALSYDYYSPLGANPVDQGWVYTNNYTGTSVYMGGYDTAVWNGTPVADPNGWRVIDISDATPVFYTYNQTQEASNAMNNGFNATWTFQMDSALWAKDATTTYTDYFINNKAFQYYAGIIFETSTGFVCYLQARPDASGNLTIYDQLNTHTLTTGGNNGGYDKMVTVTIAYDGTNMVMSYEGTDFNLNKGAPRGLDRAVFGGMSTPNRGALVYQELTVEAEFSQAASLAAPADGSSNVGENVELAWVSGTGADSHNVYVSEDMTAVANRTVTPLNTTDTSLALNLNYGTIYYWAVDEITGGVVYPGTELWTFETKANAAVAASYDYNSSLSVDPEFQGWTYLRYMDPIASEASKTWVGAYDTTTLWQSTTPAYTGPDGWRVIDGSGAGYNYYYTEPSTELAEDMKYGFNATWTFSMDSSGWSTGEINYSADWFLGSPERQYYNGIVIDTAGENGFSYYLIATADADGNLAIWDRSSSSNAPTHILTTGGANNGYETQYTLNITYNGQNAVLSYGGNEYPLYKLPSRDLDRVSFGGLSFAYWGSVVYQNLTVVADPQTIASLLAPVDNSSNLDTEVELSWNQALNADSYNVYISGTLADVENRTVTPITTSDLMTLVSDLNYGDVYYWTVDPVVGTTVYPASVIWQFAVKSSDSIVVSYDYNNGYATDPKTQGWEYVTNYPTSHSYLGGYDTAYVWPDSVTPDGWRVIDWAGDGYGFYQANPTDEQAYSMAKSWTATWTFSMDSTAWAKDSVSSNQGFFLPPNQSNQYYNGLVIDVAGSEGYAYYIIATADADGNLAIWDREGGSTVVAPTHILTNEGNNVGYDTSYTLAISYDGTDAVISYNGVDYPLYKIPTRGLNRIIFGGLSTPYFGSVVYQELTIESVKTCGVWGYHQADLNRDCYVDLADFAELADKWLVCTIPGQSGCIEY